MKSTHQSYTENILYILLNIWEKASKKIYTHTLKWRNWNKGIQENGKTPKSMLLEIYLKVSKS